MAWLKLQHRTLYVAQREAPPLNVCRACGEEEKQQHLVECDVIYQGFWKDLIEMAEAAGMPTPSQRHPNLLTLRRPRKGLERERSDGVQRPLGHLLHWMEVHLRGDRELAHRGYASQR